MAYVSTGFSPEEEQELLTSQRKQGEATTKISEWVEKQETIRIITTVSIVFGLLYTMTQMGNLIATVRARRKET